MAMELEHEFTVPLPVEAAWTLLTDLERIAPCMPGAVLLGADEGVYRGTVQVKVGPISARYEGTASFLELDEVDRRAVPSRRGP